MKIGLVLEGGGMRAMYSAGILDILMEKQIEVDGVVGVSAGSFVGANFVSRQRGRVIRYNKRFNGKKGYIGLEPWLKEGNIVSTSFAYKLVPEKLDPFDNETFKNSPVDFFAVVTNVHTGMAEYMKITDLFKEMDILRASGSMPFVSRPVRIGSQRYLDGGLADSIPYQWMLQQGYDKVIVVLTQDESYRKKPYKEALVKNGLFRYPRLAERMLARPADYNRTLEELKSPALQDKVFVIRPSKALHISKLEKNPAKLQKVYDLGRLDGYSCLKGLKAFLEPASMTFDDQ